MDREEPATQGLEQFAAEHRRIEARRRLLNLPRQEKGHWAVALSGGGIRSATFCLGVLQAMARAKAPDSDGARDGLGKRLLARFDYLSTVSGGGYLGSFFGSLFVPGRLHDTPDAPPEPVKAAEDAYRVLDYEPPGRIHTSTDYRDSPPGEAPLAWLRENGRYLTPGGAGDLFYMLGLSLRNLLAVHFVIGMPLLFALALTALLQSGVALSPLCIPNNGLAALDTAKAACQSLWWLPALVVMIGVIPLMLAFWMIYGVKSQDDPVRPFNNATALYAAAGALLGGMAYTLTGIDGDLRILLAGSSALCGMGLLYCGWLAFYLRFKQDRDPALARQNTVSTYRLLVTRRLATALIVTLVTAFLALVTWLSQWLYNLHGPLISTATLLAVAVAGVRAFSAQNDDKAAPGWLSRLPISLIAGVVGGVIFLLTALVWALLVQFVRDNGPADGDWQRLAALAAVALLLSLGAGRFIGFINLSSLQSFYRSRLARAYLGASNGLRFDGATRKIRKQRMSVTDTLPGDDLPIEDYYRDTTCAPVHLINVTMNLTVDPSEQLVQRDRKGKPLCLAPGDGVNGHVSYILDGYPRTRSTWCGASEIYQPLGLAHWVATSGAAVATGLGRATSLGTSLSLGLTNIRLGTWWPSNFVERGEAPDANLRNKDSLFKRAFTTQTYLYYELTAHFHGLRRDFQYLSDGGHFENTATYELIRQGRDVELIVTCDCGADPTYRFDDLANLIRLARIDQALEISEDPGVHEDPVLAPWFGHIESFAKPGPGDSRRCAMLLNVTNQHGKRTSRILLLKPNVITGLPVDVLNYASEHSTFPNESTANQFFDEAQFESYRQLGLQIGQTLFGGGTQGNEVAEALWAYLKHT